MLSCRGSHGSLCRVCPIMWPSGATDGRTSSSSDRIFVTKTTKRLRRFVGRPGQAAHAARHRSFSTLSLCWDVSCTPANAARNRNRSRSNDFGICPQKLGTPTNYAFTTANI